MVWCLIMHNFTFPSQLNFKTQRAKIAEVNYSWAVSTVGMQHAIRDMWVIFEEEKNNSFLM
jgi:hypothetical protein